MLLSLGLGPSDHIDCSQLFVYLLSQYTAEVMNILILILILWLNHSSIVASLLMFLALSTSIGFDIYIVMFSLPFIQCSCI